MKNIILLLILLFTFNSCSVFKTTSKKESNKKLIKSTITERDSLSIKTVNKAINDKFSLKIPNSISNDSLEDIRVNRRVNEILSSVDISKTSGDNSYRVWWDDKQKRIRVFVKVGETKNETTDTNKNNEKETTLIDEVKEEWTKVKIPWWLWLVPIFIFRKSIFSIIGFFIPGLKTAQTIRDIIPKK